MNPKVKELIKKLFELTESDPDELNETIQLKCDQIRDELDVFWYKATAEEKEEWRQYSAQCKGEINGHN